MSSHAHPFCCLFAASCIEQSVLVARLQNEIRCCPRVVDPSPLLLRAGHLHASEEGPIIKGRMSAFMLFSKVHEETRETCRSETNRLPKLIQLSLLRSNMKQLTVLQVCTARPVCRTTIAVAAWHCGDVTLEVAISYPRIVALRAACGLWVCCTCNAAQLSRSVRCSFGSQAWSCTRTRRIHWIS